jgi:hypothetical protein
MPFLTAKYVLVAFRNKRYLIAVLDLAGACIL